MMRKLGIAIIGCGTISNMHLDAASNSVYTKLITAVDSDEKKAKEAASKYGCSFHTDYRSVLKDPSVDVLHLCTPHYLHAPMAIEAMHSGKHVLSEKPMAISLDEAQNMMTAEKTTGKKLGICFQNRYNSTSVKIKEILQSGKAGRVLGAKASVAWHRDEAYYLNSDWRGTWEKEGGGVLINQAIHTLDLLQWLMGEIESIKGSYFKSLLDHAIEVEDTANAVIRFKNGVSALFYATNCYVENSPVQIELVCEKAVIKLEGELTINYSNGTTEYYQNTNPVTGEKAYWGDSHSHLIQDFYKCILSNEAFSVDGQQGIIALKMVKAIHTSSDLKQWVTF